MNFAPDFQSDGAVLARWASANMPGKKFAVVYPDTDFGKDYLAGFVSGLSDRGQLVTSNAYPADAANANEQVTVAREAAVDALLIAASPEITAAAITHAGTLQFAPRWLLSYTNAPSTLASLLGGGSEPEQLLAGFAMLGNAVSTAYLLSPVADQEAEAIIEHRRIMQTYLGPTPSSLSVYGQSLAEITVEAISGTCNDLTRTGLMKSAHAIRGFRSSLMLDGIEVNYGEQDHKAIQALQPVQIDADGAVVPQGGVIDVEEGLATAQPSGTPGASP
jgi:hypothetical protein